MKTGMMWFDADPKISLETKLAQAAKHYQNKYGLAPNAALVHPTMYPNPQNQPITLCGLEVKPDRSILPNNILIGLAS